MKKKCISLLLALTLCLSLLPVGALADGEAEPAAAEEQTGTTEITEPEPGAAEAPAEEPDPTDTPTPVGTEQPAAAEEPEAPAEAEEEILTASEPEANATTASGTCGADGDNLTWMLDEDGTLTISGEGKMGDYNHPEEIPWYDWMENITAVIVESGVTGVGNYAFYGCTSLTSVTISDGVTSILGNAFYGCTGLTSVTIPDSVTDIGWYTFYGCTGLTNVTIGNGVTWIGYAIFMNCESLTRVTIPDGVTSIEQGAFYGCTSLTSVAIPSSVESIEYGAFEKCTSLMSVTIPTSVESIGDRAFSGCTSLTSVMIPNSVTSIENSAFRGCTSLTAIGVAADNTKYASVNGVLYNKNKTELIEYPAGKSTTFAVPDGVTKIVSYAFWDCKRLTSVTIPDGVTSIEQGAFKGCTGLTRVTIPSGVTSIEGWIFDGCTSLTSVTIPDSVTSIGNAAFQHCESLTSVTIPDSVTSIGSSAFVGCESLTSVTIPDGLTSIEQGTFSACTSLTSVVIPESVTSIVDYAFYYCKNLTDVYYGGSESGWAAISIGEDNACLTSATIHYQAGTAFPQLETISTTYICDEEDFELSFLWGWSLFENDPAQYNHNLALAAALLSGATYDAQDNPAVATEILTDKLKLNNVELVNFTSGYTFLHPPILLASNTYEVDGETKTLVVAAIRGTQDILQDGLTDIYDGGVNRFIMSGEWAYTQLCQYCSSYNIDMNNGNTVFYIAGHSLGGATAGRLAIELKNHSIDGKTFVYTLASAKYEPEGYSASDFPYIHNIINIGDPVPAVPPWGSHVGYRWYYNVGVLTGVDVRMHTLKTYLSNLLKSLPCAASETVDIYKLLGIRCPVDVNVYDAEGNLIGYTQGETVVNPDSLSVMLFVNGEEKYVYLPIDGSYTVEIVGTGEGTMEYTVQTYDGYMQMTGSKTFENVVIKENKQFESPIDAETAASDTPLYVVDTDGTPTADVQEDGQETPITTVLKGDVNGDGSVDMKDVLRLMKYVGGQNLTLKVSGDINGDTSVDMKDVLRLMKYVGGQNLTIH